MDEIVVAKADRSMIAVAAILAALVLSIDVVFGSWITRSFLVLLGVTAVYRLARMKLLVTRSKVVIVNYTRRHEFPLNEVEVVQVTGDDDDYESSALKPLLLSDVGGKFDTSGRMLYLTDRSGQAAHVGLAPAYGTRLDTIAEDLDKAIETMRAVG